jgi:FkbM family methyltransferase
MLTVVLFALVNRTVCEETTRKQTELTEKTEPISKVTTIDEVAPPPSYSKIVPIKGWNRYSGDSARSLKGWLRWWKYLFMKNSIIMKWVGGLILRIYPGNEIYRSIFVRGIYDPNLVILTNALLPKDGIFIDAGANMGYVSLLASRAIGNEGHIFALEPSSRDFARLKDNINLNNLGDIISSYRLSISDKNGKAQLLIADEERSALNTLGFEIGCKGVGKIGVEEVETITTDSLIDREKIKRVDLIKLDIEGSEFNALKGARNVIEKFRPSLIIRVNSNTLKTCNADCDKLQKIIGEMRYYIYKIVEDPIFSLEKVENLLDVNGSVVICLHESIIPPVLPQPDKRSMTDHILDFFLR